ncbi:HEPN domain-containing protein [Olivibacter domesticus]|uniref:HEPN domain-containing protein n=1 Tax=Olivibacter domesticus TaxID=407022 RepID=A0A1H7SFH9_OLID1|nr:HEPN domain-containing protein [Olivibacter domesticus]SEL71461.1 HEPN domain-containing protein [Olivibacter domesticus]
MKTLNTQLLVERLTKRMDLHRIFLFSYPFLGEEQLHLLLVVNPVKGLSPKTMAPIVSLCMSDTTEIPFDMILAGEWQNQLKQGSLYYTYASLPQHELFNASKKKSPLLSHKTITGLLELAQLNYEKCKKGSDEFREAVNNFIAKGDYGQATFMLHQFLELRLKGFQATVGINGGKSHNIEHLMKSVKGMAPQLLSIFPYDSPSVELLRLLDQSYVKGKKVETVEITEEEFNVLLEKCELACAAMDGMVAMMVQLITNYREQLPDSVAEDRKDVQAAKTTANTASLQEACEDFSSFPWPERYKQDVNILLDGLYQQHRPEQIIMLNYHTEGFSGSNLFQEEEEEKKQGNKVELYLVLLMKNIGPYRFKAKQQGVASATIIYLNVDYVRQKLGEGDRFVHTLWTKGCLLRKKSTFSPSFTVADVDWKAEYESVKSILGNAIITMENLRDLIEKGGKIACDIGLLLLSDLLQIGVYTYLKCRVGFIPSKLSLLEVFGWTGVTGRQIFDRLTTDVEENMHLLHLSLHPKQIWWQDQLMNEDMISWYFLDKVREYFTLFNDLCHDTLKELKNKAEKEQIDATVI